MSSQLNLEPLVSHHITHLPPPAVCADPATKHLLPLLVDRALQALFRACGNHTSERAQLPAPVALDSASLKGCGSFM